MTDKELLLNLYLTQVIILIIAFLLSFFIYGSWFFPFTLIQWDIYHIGLGIILALIVVVIELILAKCLPKTWFDDGGINERVFKKRSPFHIVIIAGFVGFSEEILFRGVLQTTIGYIPASIIFAIIHIRYLYNPFLFLFTVGLSFGLGAIYMYTGNLLTVIICHIFIDMLLGLFIRYNVLNLQK
ncbi:CPBP family intramembrane metalloprotease [Evansella sp. AB-P1]|uniref:CPBP family intramembrane glutamic endopeptidase n=1 Tax=Evansella sp. AB-P1 TaxID=3037653 RepID=UPI00241DD17B|nr:CPBP family intramembrane glutamic endopeptidase [Evansella sp. AB-P1]MDG5787639.1 CPBP family intramembrane metalloprotease [Evansella sp. AB-P1]